MLTHLVQQQIAKVCRLCIVLCYHHVSLATLQHFPHRRPFGCISWLLIKGRAQSTCVRAQRFEKGSRNKLVAAVRVSQPCSTWAVLVKANHEHFTNVFGLIGEVVQLCQQVNNADPPSSKSACADLSMADTELKLIEQTEGRVKSPNKKRRRRQNTFCSEWERKEVTTVWGTMLNT